MELLQLFSTDFQIVLINWKRNRNKKYKFSNFIQWALGWTQEAIWYIICIEFNALRSMQTCSDAERWLPLLSESIAFNGNLYRKIASCVHPRAHWIKLENLYFFISISLSINQYYLKIRGEQLKKFHCKIFRNIHERRKDENIWKRRHCKSIIYLINNLPKMLFKDNELLTWLVKMNSQ